MNKQDIERAIEFFENAILSEVDEDGYKKFYYYDLAIRSLKQQLNTDQK